MKPWIRCLAGPKSAAMASVEATTAKVDSPPVKDRKSVWRHDEHPQRVGDGLERWARVGDALYQERPEKRDGGGVGEPLYLLPLVPPGPPETDEEGGHGGQPGEEHHGKRDVLDEDVEGPLRAHLLARRGRQQRRAPLGPEKDSGQRGDRGDGGATDPTSPPPPARRRTTVGEKQGQEHEDQAETRGPGPVADPGGQRPEGDRTGPREQPVGGVLVPEVRQPLEEADCAEDPPNRVPRPVRGDKRPDDGEGHRQDRNRGYAVLDDGLAQGTPVEEGEGQAPQGEADAQEAEKQGQPRGDARTRPAPSVPQF